MTWSTGYCKLLTIVFGGQPYNTFYFPRYKFMNLFILYQLTMIEKLT